MRSLRAWFLRLAGLFRKEQRDRELADEIESHLQLHIDDNLRRGMTPAEARRDALLKLGGVEQTKEIYRARRGLPTLDTFFQDVRFGFRQLRKNPGFTAVAVFTLALGIGANTAIFSVVNAVLLRPLPVKAPEQLVALNNAGVGHRFPAFSYPNYRDLRDQTRVLSDLLGYRFAPVGLSHEGVNQRVWCYLVTGNYFQALGVQPHLGRLFSPDDDRMPGAHPVAVLSYLSWQKRFGGQPGIVGKTFIANGRSYTVIGVAPQGFSGTEIVAAPEIWFPLAMQGAIDVGADWLEARGAATLLVQGRLKPGVTLAQARADLNSIAQGLARDFPDVNEGMRITLSTPGLAGSAFRGPALGFAALLMAVVGLVLLLACTNLANLLLARATERREEIAVRLALGASRVRLVRQLLTESLLLAFAGGLLGILPALRPIQLSVQLRPPIDFPVALDVHWDYRVLLFAGLLTVLTGLAFGLLPALQATKTEVSPVLKGGGWLMGRRRGWARGSLIIVQVALSLVLLTGGGLMLRALRQAHTLDLGFVTDSAVEISFDLKLQGYDNARGREIQMRLLEQVRALAGVQAAGLADLVPVDLHFARATLFVEGQAQERSANTPVTLASRVTPGYFAAMGTRLLAGRDFSDFDRESSAPVAVVSQAFARRFWPAGDAIGKRFSLRSPEAPKMQVIGVVQDAKYSSLTEDPLPFVYRSLWQSYSGPTTLVVRSSADAQEIIAALRREVRQLDPHMPVATAAPLGDRLSLALLPARIAASVLGTFALLGLLLAAIGIYGVISYNVSRRTHEMGIRMALGARRADLLSLIIGQGMKPVLAGMVIGLPAGFALTRLMKSVLFGVSATDPLTYGAVAALLAAVALLACYLPARRAARVDPMVALRYE